MKISATLRCGPGARYWARTASDSLERVTSLRSEARKSSSLMPSSCTCAASVASTTGATISETWPIRNTPSAPSMTSVGVSSAAANSASTNGASSAALSSMNPRSPPWSLEISVEARFATSSNAMPALRSASALAAAAFASAMAGASGAVSPSGVTGWIAISHAWRSSGVVASSASRASTSASVTVTPCWGASCSMIRPSISCSSATEDACWLRWSSAESRACASSAPDAPRGQQRPDAALRVVDAEVVDGELAVVLVLRDRLAVHRARRRQVVVVPRGGEGDDQEQERGDDGHAEADVEEHRAAVPIVPGSCVLAGRPAAERRHGAGGSSWMGPSRRRVVWR